ncbi:MAG: hypothetical protein AMJ73_01265 [candidate division Zixibacteria bacterium SM1_73]|nr:MAG: hypothetical protein AMJ73_01265 [candidate division Zixibacteria bacterium SM1_73]
MAGRGRGVLYQQQWTLWKNSLNVIARSPASGETTKQSLIYRFIQKVRLLALLAMTVNRVFRQAQWLLQG